MGNQYTILVQQYDFLQSPQWIASKGTKSTTNLVHDHEEKYSLIKVNNSEYSRVYYRIVPNFHNQLDIFQWRYHSNDPIIKVYHVEVLPPFQKNNTIIKVYTEHLVKDLNQLKNLSITQVLYIFQQSLLGLAAMSKKIKICKILAQNFGITSSGHCKIWNNSNFSQNYSSLSNNHQQISQKELIKQLFQLIKKTTNSESSYFLKRFQRQFSNQEFNFQDALDVINIYCKTKQIQLPKLLIFDFKPYVTKQKPSYSFSTQLAKKNKPQNMVLSELKFKDKSLNVIQAKKNNNKNRYSLGLNAQTIHLDKKRNSLGNYQSFYCQALGKNSIIDQSQYDHKLINTNACLNSTISYSSKQSIHMSSFQKSRAEIDINNSLLRQISEKEQQKGILYTDEEDQIVEKSQRSSQAKNAYFSNKMKEYGKFICQDLLSPKLFTNKEQKISRIQNRPYTNVFNNKIKIMNNHQNGENRTKIKSKTMNCPSPSQFYNMSKQNICVPKKQQNRNTQHRNSRINSFRQSEQNVKQQVNDTIIQNNQWKTVIKRLLISDKQLNFNKSVSIGNISQDSPNEKIQPSLKMLGKYCNVTKSIVPN